MMRKKFFESSYYPLPGNKIERFPEVTCTGTVCSGIIDALRVKDATNLTSRASHTRRRNAEREAA